MKHLVTFSVLYLVPETVSTSHKKGDLVWFEDQPLHFSLSKQEFYTGSNT